ncbi:flagellar basal-body MS-ring/collar protein FliF [Virgibacillus halophilus]|uniref:Flagellar basal-body MS-ring/collar protein FliF n=1 Tax=Tigheibacillus halophilus TaxID=361280 RepID=A0ABU5CAK0_9BACI|nr:flagellar basal-body MS-ring/collar protein FliF [Virgibacillus halophilus]
MPHSKISKKDVEHDIQRRVQQMLGTMVGLENVIVSVTADIDFTKENSVSEIVEPVDKESMEGLPVSVEKIHETYANKPADAGGTAGTGDEDIATYQASDEDQNGDYEIVKEKINNEFNKIHKEIVQSPYKIRDLGIQVAVNRIKDKSEDEVKYLSQQEQNTVQDGITSILDSIITTSVDKGYGEVDPNTKSSIVFQDFNGSSTTDNEPVSTVPVWIYIVGGMLVLLVIILLILMFRRRRDLEDEMLEEPGEIQEDIPEEIPELETDNDSDSIKRRKQLEKMAKEQPEDFAKLLRSWISED